MSEQVVVASVGIMSAVGLSAAETEAAVRARMMRFAETAYRDKHFEPFTLALVPNDEVPKEGDTPRPPRGTAREERMLGLAARALRECLAPLSSDAAKGLPLIVALPETESRIPLNRERFVTRLAANFPSAIDVERSVSTHAGRAGGLAAIGQAVVAIQGGYADFIVAGGVDSYCDLYVLGTLDMEQRIKSSTNLDGFIPGEGAAFLLLARANVAKARGLPARAVVSQVAVGNEAGHLYSAEPYRGDGLATTLAQLGASGAFYAPVADVYSSMNGESHWAKEWGVGYARNRSLFEADIGMHHPADSLGDTGSASGPLMVGLASLGVSAGHRRSPALVYASSDRGARAALAVTLV